MSAPRRLGFLDAYLGAVEARTPKDRQHSVALRCLKTRHWTLRVPELRQTLTQFSRRTHWAIAIEENERTAVAIVEPERHRIHIFDPLMVVMIVQRTRISDIIREFCRAKKIRQWSSFDEVVYRCSHADLPGWQSERIVACQVEDLLRGSLVRQEITPEAAVAEIHATYPALTKPRWLPPDSVRSVFVTAMEPLPTMMELGEDDTLLEEGGGGFSLSPSYQADAGQPGAEDQLDDEDAEPDARQRAGSAPPRSPGPLDSVYEPGSFEAEAADVERLINDSGRLTIASPLPSTSAAVEPEVAPPPPTPRRAWFALEVAGGAASFVVANQQVRSVSTQAASPPRRLRSVAVMTDSWVGLPALAATASSTTAPRRLIPQRTTPGRRHRAGRPRIRVRLPDGRRVWRRPTE
jgi:hypothetical protein